MTTLSPTMTTLSPTLILSVCVCLHSTLIHGQNITDIPSNSKANPIGNGTALEVPVPVVAPFNATQIIVPPPPSAPVIPTPTRRCGTVEMFSNYPCILTSCLGRHHKITCNAVTERDLRTVLGLYTDFINRPRSPQLAPLFAVPLYVSLNRGDLNLTRELLAPIADRLGKLELRNVNLGERLNEHALNDLRNLTVLTLDGCTLDVVPNGAFEGLASLQALTLRNLNTLKSLEQGVFEPVLGSVNINNSTTSSGLRCLDINITSSSFNCRCSGGGATTWIQDSLARATPVNMFSSSWVDRYADIPTTTTGDAARGLCDVAIVCSNDSDVGLRQLDITDANLTVACPPPPTPPPVLTIVLAKNVSDGGVAFKTVVTSGFGSGAVVKSSGTTMTTGLLAMSLCILSGGLLLL
ncbi:hypothetical protein BV898_16128 [Hypsibius exemplaris]|uniref:Uncharacterized protein n=1 Tax=Hypsibius exemplaris TaxID=2072580 RepID=A0A9X6NLE4_HYPEX|nr:hypothetical protein BV898_16128 [Hypsibius exemplaris]